MSFSIKKEKKPESDTAAAESRKNTLRRVGKITLRVLSYIANVLLTLLLVGTLCAVIIGTVFCIYIKNYVDPTIDSSLFATASSDKTTRVYYMDYETEEVILNGIGNRVFIVVMVL